ncbi:MAG: methyltransferase [Chloroflexi bacterium]|nr:methyltransferase [Chloroflexota bacterium]
MDERINPTSYLQEHTLETDLAGEKIHIITRPGFPDWDRVTQATELLVDRALLGSNERVLVFPCGHGALGVWAARCVGASRVFLRDTNIIAARVARRTCDANDCQAVDVAAALPEPDSVEVALVTLPKGRDFARLVLLSAARALVRGGRLYLAGANRAGIKSVARDVEALLGPGRLLGYKGGHRAFLFTASAPTEDALLPDIFAEPGIPQGTYHQIEAMVGGNGEAQIYRLDTRPGIFSWEHLDPGTALLLNVVRPAPDERLLDAGCGYGILGIHLGLQASHGETTLVDTDILAIECARRNVGRYGPQNARLLLEDVIHVLDAGPYTLIVSNPPFHSGQDVRVDMTYALIHGAYEALLRNGRLVLVANRFLPYRIAMEARFGNVITLAATGQYHVLEARKLHRRGSRREARARQTQGDQPIYESRKFTQNS